MIKKITELINLIFPFTGIKNDINILDMQYKVKEYARIRHRVIGIAVFFIAINLLMANVTSRKLVIPDLNTNSRVTVIAPFTYDIMKTPQDLEREKLEAAAKVLPIVHFNEDLTSLMLTQLGDFREIILGIARNFQVQEEINGQFIENNVSQFVSHRSANVFIRDTTAFKFLIDEVEQRVRKGVMDVHFVKDNIEKDNFLKNHQTSLLRVEKIRSGFIEARFRGINRILPRNEYLVYEEAVQNIFENISLHYYDNRDFLQASHEFLNSFVRPNVIYDKNLTEQNIIAEMSNVSPVKGRVLKGMKIIERDEYVTTDAWEKLVNLKAELERRESYRNAIDIFKRLINILFVNMLAVIFIYHITILLRSKQKSKNNRVFFAFLSLFVISLLFSLLIFFASRGVFDTIIDFSLLMRSHISPSWYYLVPVGLAGIVITQFFGVQVGLVATVYYSVFNSIIWNNDLNVFIFSFIISCVVAYAIRRMRYVSHYIFYMFFILLAISFITVAIIESLKFEINPSTLKLSMVMVTIASAYTVFIGMILITIFQRISGIAAPFKLIELSDMNNSLLKQLSAKAPGTYHHSLLVSQIAEACANKIGANGLLLRVASLYHDIGKIYKPDYFIENQQGVNLHDKHKPSISAKIIQNHVKKGEELAKKYELPEAITDIIREHHGTTLVKFFYNKAMKEQGNMDMFTFAYPGPKPQTKEAAILMIADTFEAAARSLEKKSYSSIKAILNDIIKEKIDDGQFDECNITLRELEEIREAMVLKVASFFHVRLDYDK